MTKARSTQVNIRLGEDELAAIQRAADEAGLSVSEWLRLIARAAAGMRQLDGHLRRAAKAASRGHDG